MVWLGLLARHRCAARRRLSRYPWALGPTVLVARVYQARWTFVGLAQRNRLSYSVLVRVPVLNLVVPRSGWHRRK